MMKPNRQILTLLLLAGCSLLNEPKNSQPWNPGESLAMGQMTFQLNGTDFTIAIVAQNNGYVQDEIVLRGSGVGMENTLMLTFKPTASTFADINLDMTGYWDLGLCIPFNKYLLTQDQSNSIRAMFRDTSIVGEFSLTFRLESDSSKIAVFKNGAFVAKLDTSHFQYCNEG